MSVLIDVPQIAYKTMELEFFIYDADGKRDFWAELEAEQDLKRRLPEYSYSEDHDHVR